MRGKTLLIGVVGIVIGVLLSTAVVFAGSLNPTAGPGDPGSQMYTLQQIWDRINNGAAATKMTDFTEPSSGPAATGQTLDDLYTLASERSRPAKTGQTTSFAAGDDGDLEKGVAWPSPRFTDNSNGTVTDNLTGLIWLKNASCANATRNWATALTDVAQLNTNGTMNSNNCGDTSNGGSHQTDWRLPNVREQQSLVHYGVVNPAVPNTAGTGKWAAGDPFTGGQSDYYYFWTSTPYADITSLAWYVYLGSGNVYVGDKTSSFYVWPVRGGQ